jgi:hypothetical protein
MRKETQSGGDSMSGQRGAETGAHELGALFSWLGSGGWSERDRPNKVAHVRWSIVLAASLLASAFMLKAGWGGSTALKWAIAALPIPLLVPWLLAYLRFLRGADELVRKIQMEGLAVGFWAGVVVGFGFIVLEEAGPPRLHLNSAVAIMLSVMMVGYAVGRVLAGKRYG